MSLEGPSPTAGATLHPSTTGGPSPTSGPDTTSVTPAIPATNVLPGSWPAIDPADPVGDAMTATATVSIETGLSVWQAVVTLADGDVLIGVTAAAGDTSVQDGRLYLDGHWYEATREGWQPDPAPSALLVHPAPSDPRELLGRLSPVAGFEPDGTEVVDGVETVRLRARSPGAIDPARLAFLPPSPDTSIGSLEIWVDSNRIVRRIDVTYVNASEVDGSDIVGADGRRVLELAPSFVSIEFSAIGELIDLDTATNTQH